jgi:hypothetical protein
MAGQEKMTAYYEEMTANLDVKMDSHHEEMMALIKPGQGKVEAMMEVCLKKTEAMDLEANPEEIESGLEYQEVPKEATAVETVGALEDRYGGRHLAVGRRRKSKKRT